MADHYGRMGGSENATGRRAMRANAAGMHGSIPAHETRRFPRGVLDGARHSVCCCASDMRLPVIVLSIAFVAGGCAHALHDRHADRMQGAADRYLACLSAEAEKEVTNPASSEEIALRAQGRCWEAWEAYKNATRLSFALGAVTPEEQQLAADKTDAHLRQFDQQARRKIMDAVADRSLRGSGQPR